MGIKKLMSKLSVEIEYIEGNSFPCFFFVMKDECMVKLSVMFDTIDSINFHYK